MTPLEVVLSVAFVAQTCVARYWMRETKEWIARAAASQDGWERSNVLLRQANDLNERMLRGSPGEEQAH